MQVGRGRGPVTAVLAKPLQQNALGTKRNGVQIPGGFKSVEVPFSAQNAFGHGIQIAHIGIAVILPIRLP